MSPEDIFKEKKSFYLGEKFYKDLGFNASWGLDLPMGEMQYKEITWYTPGDLKIYREDNAWKIHEMNIIRLYKEQGIDYSEQDLETYIKELKNTIIEDIKSTFKFAKNSKISTEYDSNLNEIIVLIFENQNIWKKAIGLKYGYFFIREEKDYCYSMVYNKKIFEGTLEELKGFFKSKKNVVGEFKFYLKWDWE
jgi:hypothetical protein